MKPNEEGGMEEEGEMVKRKVEDAWEYVWNLLILVQLHLNISYVVAREFVCNVMPGLPL